MDEAFLGSIMLFPYTFVPQDWLSCEGQVLNVNQYQALYSLIGQLYPGGNGSTTFALPNLKGAEPVPNMRYCISTQGLYPQRP